MFDSGALIHCCDCAIHQRLTLDIYTHTAMYFDYTQRSGPLKQKDTTVSFDLSDLPRGGEIRSTVLIFEQWHKKEHAASILQHAVSS